MHSPVLGYKIENEFKVTALAAKPLFAFRQFPDAFTIIESKGMFAPNEPTQIFWEVTGESPTHKKRVKYLKNCVFYTCEMRFHCKEVGDISLECLSWNWDFSSWKPFFKCFLVQKPRF